ncbi:MAG TPA: efflux RND transporter permease subunit [Planctomycetota bacterium]|nr:efflux RND transporter permease subunit [Planctomycetota bacterium]
MNIVSTATSLRRPVMIIVAMLALALAAISAVQKIPRDIFPDLGVPVIYVSQPYGGMDPSQMEQFLMNHYEDHFLYISGIEHIETKTIQGSGLVKVQFHEGTNMAQAMAEVIGQVNRSRAFMPPGTVPPTVIRFDAGSVPIGDLVFESQTRRSGELQDMALTRVRPLLSTLPGVSSTPPFGASARTIVIRVDPDRLRSYNMAPEEVVQALIGANSIAASGNVNVGNIMYMVPNNATVHDIKELENVPIRPGSTNTVFLRDIGTVEDGNDMRTGYATVNGRHTVYIPVTKRADASTLTVVDLVKSNMKKFQEMLPSDVKVTFQFDQSPYVTRAIAGLLSEGVMGAILTGLMILIFLWDFKSALIVTLNIPLCIMASLLALWVCGQTINIMTLGGLALAVGILVDEATVTIENIHTHLAEGKPISLAALDATNETTIPRFLSMLCILAVFIPAFFMAGSTKALFIPLSMALGFSMIASYTLSSTLVPVLTALLLKDHYHGAQGTAAAQHDAAAAPHAAAEAPHPTHDKSFFSKIVRIYAACAGFLLKWRWAVIPCYFVGAILIVAFVGSTLGTEIFPKVDEGQFQLRFREATGTRIEETERTAAKTLDIIKSEVGPDSIEMTLGFVGVQPPNYSMNSIYQWSGGPEEAVLQVQLKHGVKVKVPELQETLRKRFAKELPGVEFSFEPSDIISRVMSFGAATPVEIAIAGPGVEADLAFGEKIRAKLAAMPSMRDIHYGEALDYPALRVNVDRERAGVMGLTTTEIIKSLTTATSSSRYVVANFWADDSNGIGYQVQVEFPQAKIKSIEDVQNIPVAKREGQQLLLRNVASVTKSTAEEQIDRYNTQKTLTLCANISGEDLGRVSKKVNDAIASLGAPPPRVSVEVRGQIAPMNQMMAGLQNGFLIAIVVIFLLLWMNFQSLKLSLIVVSTVPAVASGVCIMLWLTGTTLNIQSFMGAIMSIGVAVANSILLVTFAERTRLKGESALNAALEGASSRLRPIMMTSCAMIAGMIPMALGMGESGEQSAPLGRAVVGGLAFATVATLFILPSVYTLVMWASDRKTVSLNPHDPYSERFVRHETPPHAHAVAAGD